MNEEELIDTGTTSIHVSKNDVKLFGKHRMRDIGVGEAYHRAVKEMDMRRDLITALNGLFRSWEEGDLNLAQFHRLLREEIPKEPGFED